MGNKLLITITAAINIISIAIQALIMWGLYALFNHFTDGPKHWIWIIWYIILGILILYTILQLVMSVLSVISHWDEW